MGPMGELGALFNPGMRHELAERKAKALRREEEGNAGDGELRIDLETGVATIKIQAQGDEVPRDADDDAGRVDPEDEDSGAEDPDDLDATEALAPAVDGRPDTRPASDDVDDVADVDVDVDGNADVDGNVDVGGNVDVNADEPEIAPRPRVTGKSGRRRSA